MIQVKSSVGMESHDTQCARMPQADANEPGRMTAESWGLCTNVFQAASPSDERVAPPRRETVKLLRDQRRNHQNLVPVAELLRARETRTTSFGWCSLLCEDNRVGPRTAIVVPRVGIADWGRESPTTLQDWAVLPSPCAGGVKAPAAGTASQESRLRQPTNRHRVDSVPQTGKRQSLRDTNAAASLRSQTTEPAWRPGCVRAVFRLRMTND